MVLYCFCITTVRDKENCNKTIGFFLIHIGRATNAINFLFFIEKTVIYLKV